MHRLARVTSGFIRCSIKTCESAGLGGERGRVFPTPEAEEVGISSLAILTRAHLLRRENAPNFRRFLLRLAIRETRCSALLLVSRIICNNEVYVISWAIIFALLLLRRYTRGLTFTEVKKVYFNFRLATTPRPAHVLKNFTRSYVIRLLFYALLSY